MKTLQLGEQSLNFFWLAFFDNVIFNGTGLLISCLTLLVYPGLGPAVTPKYLQVNPKKQPYFYLFVNFLPTNTIFFSIIFFCYVHYIIMSCLGKQNLSNIKLSSIYIFTCTIVIMCLSSVYVN